MLEFLDKFDRLERRLDRLLPIERPRELPPAPPSDPRIEAAWTPNPGPQSEFYNSTCREVLYGGAAGGGKSAALTALPLRWSTLPGFEAVTFRRESTQLDDLTQKSEQLFPKVYAGLEPVRSPNYEWTFPAGGKLKYRHCQREHDYKKYDGWEINLVCFDELTHFTEKQYKAICARVRSANPKLPTLIRSTTNPGGDGHEWVFKHWGAWLDPEFKAPGLPTRKGPDGKKLPPALPGEVWWVRTLDDSSEAYFREEPNFGPGVAPALSRTFIPAKLEDNPHLLDNDPAYVAQLNALDPVRRAQLRNGDWLIRPGAGRYFKRTWVDFVDQAPANPLRRVRAWDLAGTEKKDSKSDPDWTVGVLMSLGRDGRIYVEDVVRFRGNPGEVTRQIKATAELDTQGITIVLPQDPGQAGKFQANSFRQELRGWIVKARPVSGDKVTRFGPFSTQAEGQLVSLVRGKWNAPYCEELEGFPDVAHDDQVDATSDAFKFVSSVNRLFAAVAKGAA
jgi:predicted phage terminase large subunit-like protein